MLCETVLGKNPPGNPLLPDSKPNPIPNLTLTLPWTPHGGFFPGGIFPDTVRNIRGGCNIKAYSYYCSIFLLLLYFL